MLEEDFQALSNLIEKPRIEPIVSKLLSPIKEFCQKLNRLQMLLDKSKIDQIKEINSFLFYV